MELYMEDKEVTEAAKKATKIKIAVGDEGIHRLLASGLTDTDIKAPNNIWKLLEDQLDASVKINYCVHRLDFSHMWEKPKEAIFDYITWLRKKADKCEFGKAELNECLIEMIILSTPFNDFRKELFAKPKDW